MTTPQQTNETSVIQYNETSVHSVQPPTRQPTDWEEDPTVRAYREIYRLKEELALRHEDLPPQQHLHHVSSTQRNNICGK